MEKWFNAPQKLFSGRRQRLPRYVSQTAALGATEYACKRMLKISSMTHPSSVIATIFGIACVLSLCCITAPAYAWWMKGTR
jgi:hypothetical protein